MKNIMNNIDFLIFFHKGLPVETFLSTTRPKSKRRRTKLDFEVPIGLFYRKSRAAGSNIS